VSGIVPGTTTEAGYYDTPGAAVAVAVSGNYAYVADNYAGLRVIDVANPESLTETGYYDGQGTARGVAVSESYAYVPQEGLGLRIYQYMRAGVADTPNPGVRMPNPSPTVVRGVLMIGDRGPKTGDRAELLDASGKKVLDLKTGANDVNRLAPGVYFVQEAQAQTVQKIIVQN
jgi:hypothetical protein